MMRTVIRLPIQRQHETQSLQIALHMLRHPIVLDSSFAGIVIQASRIGVSREERGDMVYVP